MTRIDIRKAGSEAILSFVKERKQPVFRAKQIDEWLWKKAARDFDDMTNLPKAFREDLKSHFDILPITLDLSEFSNDGTIKSRFKLHDGHLIESVLIPVPDDKRFTVCVSSQVGCSLSCSFCATGRMKRERNLDPAEIYDQVIMVNAQCDEHFGRGLTNVVYMGMGEPLLAYKNVFKSIELITSPEGLGWSPRRITVSTAGIEKMIRKLADDEVKFNLALSLHAADDKKRDEIMPINEQNNLEALMTALRYFYKKTRNKISFEYIAFQHFNDQIEDADKLAALCAHFPVTVNIIEYNPIDNFDMIKSDVDQIDRFAQRLRSKDIMVTLRRSRGKDINAACGQLIVKEKA